METINRKRRRFIKGVILVTVTATAFWRFLVPGRKSVTKPLLEVKKEDIPPAGALVYKRSRVVVIRKGDEYYAMSLICTHLGCTVNVTPDNLVCPCHGSIFDREGRVLKGPSNRPLDRYQVEDRGDTLVVLT